MKINNFFHLFYVSWGLGIPLCSEKYSGPGSIMVLPTCPKSIYYVTFEKPSSPFQLLNSDNVLLNITESVSLQLLVWMGQVK